LLIIIIIIIIIVYYAEAALTSITLLFMFITFRVCKELKIATTK